MTMIWFSVNFSDTLAYKSCDRRKKQGSIREEKDRRLLICSLSLLPSPIFASTHHLVETIHLCKYRQLFPRLQNRFVLRRVRKLCKWVYIVFLGQVDEIYTLKQSTANSTYQCLANLVAFNFPWHETKESPIIRCSRELGVGI